MGRVPRPIGKSEYRGLSASDAKNAHPPAEMTGFWGESSTKQARCGGRLFNPVKPPKPVISTAAKRSGETPVLRCRSRPFPQLNSIKQKGRPQRSGPSMFLTGSLRRGYFFADFFAGAFFAGFFTAAFLVAMSFVTSVLRSRPRLHQKRCSCVTYKASAKMLSS